MGPPPKVLGDADDFQIPAAVAFTQRLGDGAAGGRNGLHVPHSGGLVFHLQVRREGDALEQRVHVPEFVFAVRPPLLLVLLVAVDLLAERQQTLHADLPHEFRLDVGIRDFVDPLHRDLGMMRDSEPLRNRHAVKREDLDVAVARIRNRRTAVAVKDVGLIELDDGRLLADDAHVLDAALHILQVVDEAELGRAFPDFVAVVDFLGLELDAKFVAEEVVEGEHGGGEAAVQIRSHEGLDLEFGLLALEVLIDEPAQLGGFVAVSRVVAGEPGLHGVIKNNDGGSGLPDQMLLNVMDDVEGFRLSEPVGVGADCDPLLDVFAHFFFLRRSEWCDHGEN